MPIHINCPGCQTPVTMPRNLAGKRVRCSRCNTVFSTPDITTDAGESEAITVKPNAPSGLGVNAEDGVPLGSVAERPDVRLQLRCEDCGQMVSFLASDIGTVQECPKCGGYIDVPEVGRPPTGAEIEDAARSRTVREWELQSQETTRQLAISAKQIEQAQRTMDHRDQQDARYDKLLDRFEQVLARWEQLAEQAGRVIEQMSR